MARRSKQKKEVLYFKPLLKTTFTYPISATTGEYQSMVGAEYVSLR